MTIFNIFRIFYPLRICVTIHPWCQLLTANWGRDLIKYSRHVITPDFIDCAGWGQGATRGDIFPLIASD